jgi:hypothetical protein
LHFLFCSDFFRFSPSEQDINNYLIYFKILEQKTNLIFNQFNIFIIKNITYKWGSCDGEKEIGELNNALVVVDCEINAFVIFGLP